MPQTLPNGLKTPINSDAYNLATDLATMGGSANVVQKVANGTAMNALTSTVGDVCIRLDLTGSPIWTYDGTTWSGPGGLVVANLTYPTGYAAVGTPYAVPACWRSGGMVFLQGTVKNTTTTTIASNSTTNVAQLPDPKYYPSAVVRFRFNATVGVAVPATDGYVTINTSGQIAVFLNNGVGTPAVGSLQIYLDGMSWIGQ